MSHNSHSLEGLKNINIIWTAYNEEPMLKRSVESVMKSCLFAAEKIKERYGLVIKFRGLICHNGCTDRTPEIAKRLEARSKESFFEIRVIESEKGMVKAQQKSIEHLSERNFKDNPVIFIDADSIAEESLIFILVEQLIKHPRLRAVGGHPKPMRYRGWNPYRKLMDSVLNCRGYFPKSEISVIQSSDFHPYAEEDPQPIGQLFEKKSKIYFHGRCFILRDLSLWAVGRESIAEDTVLDRHINSEFGPGSIRVMYNANVKFKSLRSLRTYYKTYTRIYLSLTQLRNKHPEYENARKYSKTKLDFNYVKSLPIKNQIYFYTYFLIKSAVRLLYKKGIFIIKKQNLWEYSSK